MEMEKMDRAREWLRKATLKPVVYRTAAHDRERTSRSDVARSLNELQSQRRGKAMKCGEKKEVEVALGWCGKERRTC